MATRRWAALAICTGATAVLAAGGMYLPRRAAMPVTPAPLSTDRTPVAGAAPVPSPAPTRAGGTAITVPASFPHSGPGTFQYAGQAGPVLGRAGPIRRFRVAVESNVTTQAVGEFADKIDAVLGDGRSWIASGQVRFQRVPVGAPYDFTIHLATSGTAHQMCASGGVDGTRGYTSCRYGGHVVLNLDRWYTSVPYYAKAGVPLEVYRTYMLNHEVGHELGHGHERCPGTGRPAPVMEQQTLGLHGCTPNPWPYVGGRRYAGPLGSY